MAFHFVIMKEVEDDINVDKWAKELKTFRRGLW